MLKLPAEVVKVLDLKTLYAHVFWYKGLFLLANKEVTMFNVRESY